MIQISSYRRRAIAALFLVLSASAALAQTNNVRFKGSFDGRDISVVQDGTLLANLSISDTASILGRFTYTHKATVDLATGLSRGTCQVVVANGDVINCAFVGRGVSTDTPNLGHIIELVTITGGFGRYRGATGSFILDRLVDLATLPAFALTSGTLKGAITTPAK